MKRRNKKLLIIAGAVVVVAFILANIFRSGESGTTVQAENVKMQDIVEEVSASGYVQPKTKVNITSEVTAEIIEVAVVDGQFVRKGNLLIKLDTVQLQKDFEQMKYSLEEMEARVEGSKALYLQAEEENTRQKALFERNLTSETAYKDAEYSYLNSKHSYEAMQSQFKQTRALFEKAEDNLSKTRITAPMDGIVTYIDAEPGEIAQAQTAYTQGKTLMTISDLNSFEVEVDVDETEIVKVDLNQEAKIEVDAFPDTSFVGEVVEIGNTAIMTGLGTQDQATNFKVKVLFKETNNKIRPGMSATVDITTNKRTEALVVPYGAIVMRNLNPEDSLKKPSDSSGGLVAEAHAAQVEENPPSDTDSSSHEGNKGREAKGVFVIQDGKAKFVEVETGIADQKNIEIVKGLEKDQKVISGPFRTLRTIKDGDMIKVEEQPQFSVRE